MEAKGGASSISDAEVHPLRGRGRLVDCSHWPATPENDSPRTLKALARIVDGDLCHRCGSCVGICPTGVLSVDGEEYPQVSNLGACTDCELCVKVCPGVDYHAASFSQSLYGYVPEFKDTHGHFEKAYLSYSLDEKVREISSSGGLITGLLISLLEAKAIDGALVVTSDEKDLWKGRPIIARTKEEIVQASKSKYAIVPTNVMLAQIRSNPGRYAVVGLPCQIHGLQKALLLDARLRERVLLSIGLFCHAAIEHEPMRIVWQRLGEEGQKAKRFLSRVGKHPGTPFLEMRDGSLKPVYFPWARGYRPSSTEMLNVFYRLYTPARCFTCWDSTAEHADIAVGDPWMAPPADEIKFTDGYSFVLARNERAVQLLEEAQAREDIFLFPLEKEVARTANTMMGREKRCRAARVIETLRRQGRPVPEYGIDFPALSLKHFVLTEINLLTHIFCFWRGSFWRKFRTLLFRLALSPLGYALLRLNFQKRKFRDWLRDRRARNLRLARSKVKSE